MPKEWLAVEIRTKICTYGVAVGIGISPFYHLPAGIIVNRTSWTRKSFAYDITDRHANQQEGEVVPKVVLVHNHTTGV